MADIILQNQNVYNKSNNYWIYFIKQISCLTMFEFFCVLNFNGGGLL